MAKYTQDDLDALEEAIALGASKVKYKDKEVEYRSLRDMFQLRDFMRKQLGQVKSKSGRTYLKVSKGLNNNG